MHGQRAATGAAFKPVRLKPGPRNSRRVLPHACSARDTLRTALGLVPRQTCTASEVATYLGEELPFHYCVLMVLQG